MSMNLFAMNKLHLMYKKKRLRNAQTRNNERVNYVGHGKETVSYLYI